MRKLTAVAAALALLSCTMPSNDTRLLELQVERLNLRVDSLVTALNTQGIQPLVSSKPKTSTRKKRTPSRTPKRSYTSSTTTSSGYCQAITNKGTQCSRKAKYGSYCWQHG